VCCEEGGAPSSGVNQAATVAPPDTPRKATDTRRTLGAVVGKALQPLKKGRGVIEVLVTLR